MITNRSNHIPMLTKMQIRTISQGLVRIFLLQKNCGAMTLQRDHRPVTPRRRARRPGS